MDKESFKIGDKVKLKSGYTHMFPQTTEVGKVVGFDNDNGGYILVSYSGCPYKEGFPYYLDEIEHAVMVGEQLMFSFMSVTE